MTIPFLDLGAHHAPHAGQFRSLFDEVLAQSAFIGGPFVERFEAAWADYCGTAHSIGVANGTDALELALRGAGIGPGDEVIVPANTFVATAEAVVRVGAAPVFCDVEPDTLVVSARTVEPALGSGVAAVIAVHLFGQPANMTELVELTSRHGLALIEDAAQAHGALWEGRPVGSFGVAATFSFYPGKNLGALGDGGAITTSDPGLAARIREEANHGRSADAHHRHVMVGRNSRLDGLQAAFLLQKLDGLEEANEQRRRRHADYAAHLPASARQVQVDHRARAVHHLEVVAVDDRDALRGSLAAQGIGVGVHYPVPCHRIGPYRHYRQSEPVVAEQRAAQILSLPMYPELTAEQVETVCAAVTHQIGVHPVGL